MNHRRPPEILIATIAYVCSPLLNVIAAKVASHMSLVNLLHFYLSGNIHLTYVLLLMSPLVGIGIYVGRRWGYMLFLGHAAGMLLVNASYLLTRQREMAGSYIVLDLILFGLVLHMLRKDQRAPYFSPEPRGWRLQSRIKCAVPMVLQIDSKELQATSMDLSHVGAQVEADAQGLHLGSTVVVTMGTADSTVRLTASLAWIAPDRTSLGLQFLNLTNAQQKMVMQLANAATNSALAEPAQALPIQP